MCLTTNNLKVEDAPKIGYKVFKRHTNKKLYGIIMSTRKSLPTSRWINEVDYRKSKRINYAGHAYNVYPVGWHIYEYLPTARKYILNESNEEIHRVKIRNVCAYGYEDHDRVIVAKEILIKKDWCLKPLGVKIKL